MICPDGQAVTPNVAGTLQKQRAETSVPAASGIVGRPSRPGPAGVHSGSCRPRFRESLVVLAFWLGSLINVLLRSTADLKLEPPLVGVKGGCPKLGPKAVPFDLEFAFRSRTNDGILRRPRGYTVGLHRPNPGVQESLILQWFLEVRNVWRRGRGLEPRP
jgi:hypothetical protein